MSEIEELSQVVAEFREPLRLHESDVRYIRNRFAYLKQKLTSSGRKGFPDIKLLLTSIYCYIRDPSNGRKVVSPSKFALMCRNLELSFTKRDLWRYEQLYFQYGYYPRAPISSVFNYLEAAWYDISKDLSLHETAKDQVLSSLNQIHKLKEPRRAPWIVTGAIIYLLGTKIGRYHTQEELAEYFGTSQVSLRSAAQAFEHYIKGTHFLEQ